MKLGLLTAAFPTLSLDEVADWAGGNGFQALEVAVWPAASGPSRRYAGTSHIDVESLDQGEANRVVDSLQARGLEISALAYYPNPLDPDEAAAAAAREHLRRVIRAAELLGVEVVGTFVGRDKGKPVDANLEQFGKVWPDLVHFAADHGRKIAIENCPMIFSGDEWPGGNNLAYSPSIWRQMFEILPDANFGLNLDPSHLVWQFIDAPRVVREFGSRIFHVHAKDLEIDADGLYEHGALSLGVGWQIPRICGLGQVDWNAFLGALYRVGYDGVLSVEHEDRAFEGSVGAVRRGFEIARDNLRPLVH
ncbi:MAG: Xylose isomerase domain protein barrel [Naasia sp.]|jgi:sugar phosphate isomerase/epimerase|uniref:sugar phosphate isomerase/epimerase family protein n=1 Tax=Naasia sp. TaxID=2546198 RepID=UPI002615D4A1|nr:sugar phosphate isomerase/epimerase [Naasia sp.]MCU1570901.1 Xylose isomerase domain protein barrel [Naasia sp.]